MLKDVLALDANAFMRHAVRRYLCALQEERGGNVLLSRAHEVRRIAVERRTNVASMIATEE